MLRHTSCVCDVREFCRAYIVQQVNRLTLITVQRFMYTYKAAACSQLSARLHRPLRLQPLHLLQARFQRSMSLIMVKNSAHVVPTGHIDW